MSVRSNGRLPRSAAVLAWVAGIALASVGALAAQEPPLVRLDTLRVDVASRTASAFPARSRVVQVFTAEDLAALPVRSLAEALSWMTAADLQPRSSAQADLSLRGSTFEQVLVLVDGVRMSDPQTGHFDLDLAIPLDRVERIEVLEGPASALYGADAMGGVVNVVTREGGTSASGRAERGTFATWRADGSVDGAIGGGVRGGASAEWDKSDGYRAGTDFETWLLHGRVSAPVAGGRVAVQAGRASRDFGADNFYGNYPSYEETRSTTVSAGWSGPIGGGFVLHPLFSLRRHDDDFVLFRTRTPSAYENVHLSRQTGGEVLLHRAPTNGIALALGGEMYRDHLESERVDLHVPSLGDRDEDRRALFGEAGWSGARASVSAGLRDDWRELSGDTWSPSVSGSVDVTPSFRLRSAFGRSFRAPSWTERYYTAPNRTGNPNLRPETSWTVEVGADLALPGSGVLRVTNFHRKAEDLIDWVRPAGSAASVPFAVRNIESATYRGVDVALEQVRFSGFQLEAAASSLALDSDEAAGLTSYYALHPIDRRVLLGLTRPFGDGRVTLSGRGLIERRRDGDTHALLGATARIQLLRGTLEIIGSNLTDAQYHPFPKEIVPVTAAGRAVSVGYRLTVSGN